MKNYSVRTDLALEEKERFASDNVEVQGVVLEEEYDEENEIRLDPQHKDQAHPVSPPCYRVRQKGSLILFHLHRRFYERSIPGCNHRSAPAIPGYFLPHPMPDPEIPVSDKYLSVFP